MYLFFCVCLLFFLSAENPEKCVEKIDVVDRNVEKRAGSTEKNTCAVRMDGSMSRFYFVRQV